MMLSVRQKLRTRLRDGAAFSAFAGVALSGTVPIWSMVIFGVCLVMSLFGIHPLARRRASSAILLVIAAIALFGFVFLGTLDLVVAAVSFAILVTAHRLASESTRATDQQVLLASLLLMAGGAALSGELWYAVCLAGFGITSCLHLGLAAIEGPEEKDELLPVRPVIRQLSIGVFFSLIAGVMFFFAFPRLSWNLAARRTSPDLLGAAPGMSDRVRMGGSGTLKTSARMVARISISPDPGKDRLDEYWPGRYFDSFDGREWTGSGVDQPPTVSVRVGESGTRPILQKIELLPAYQAQTLIALRDPVNFSSASLQTPTGALATPLVEARGEEVRFPTSANGYTYHASSRPPADRPGAVLENREKFLALPSTIDARVAPLIDSVLKGETNEARVADRLEAWLKRDFAYTLELPGEQPDPLADFLFVKKAGRCEHFAFALAVSLRMKGIPARVVAGYFGGERINNLYVIRAGDAHAWTQAFIQGRGWVDFDATPEGGRRGQPPAFMATLVSLYEQIENYWRSNVVDYSLQDQVRIVRDLVKPPAEASSKSTFWLSWKPIVGALFAAGLAWALVRLLQRRITERPHVATHFLNRVEAALTERKIVRTDGEGLEELARRLRGANHPLAIAVTEITNRYVRARFGNRPMTREDETRLLGLLDSKE